MNLLKYRIKTFFKYQDLVRELVQRDLKLKYRRSFLGYLWSVLNPLLIMIVLTVVFSNLFNKSIKNFPVYLFTGRMLYDFLKASTTNAMKSVTGNAALLKKVYIPKYIFTFAKVTSCMVDMVLSMHHFTGSFCSVRWSSCSCIFSAVALGFCWQNLQSFSGICSTFITRCLRRGCI